MFDKIYRLTVNRQRKIADLKKTVAKNRSQLRGVDTPLKIFGLLTFSVVGINFWFTTLPIIKCFNLVFYDFFDFSR
jgi:hypothetical protein